MSVVKEKVLFCLPSPSVPEHNHGREEEFPEGQLHLHPSPLTHRLHSRKSTKRHLSPGTRRKREFMPEDKKDACYWFKRKKNNEAAKRSREKRRFSDLLMESKLVALVEENACLKAELVALKIRFGLIKDSGLIQSPTMLYSNSLPFQSSLRNKNKGLGGCQSSALDVDHKMQLFEMERNIEMCGWNKNDQHWCYNLPEKRCLCHSVLTEHPEKPQTEVLNKTRNDLSVEDFPHSSHESHQNHCSEPAQVPDALYYREHFNTKRTERAHQSEEDQDQESRSTFLKVVAADYEKAVVPQTPYVSNYYTPSRAAFGQTWLLPNVGDQNFRRNLILPWESHSIFSGSSHYLPFGEVDCKQLPLTLQSNQTFNLSRVEHFQAKVKFVK
ncbi:uncharacterized protein LOC127529979 [Erpetoichthys calabaricus]|uniref:uncharacterized protein LOC127529979 n=1 Tax=Erpetoichthys calabaricus TaxID=27687 RepID=UPI002234306F|nr:uncharacterized protein LOC127529979 [Erpetoichthys calabaricus]